MTSPDHLVEFPFEMVCHGNYRIRHVILGIYDVIHRPAGPGVPLNPALTTKWDPSP